MTTDRSSIGYGSSGRWQRLMFDGDERSFEQWEFRFLGYMLMKDLKKHVLPATDGETDEDAAKQEMAFAELIQFLDEKSLGLVIREAKDNGRKAFQILRQHYSGTSQPRILTLWNDLICIQMSPKETVTEFIIRVEKITTALKAAKEQVSDGLIISQVLKCLPEEFSSFVVVTTQNTELNFANFKTKLRNFEDTEKSRHVLPKRDDKILKSQHGKYGGVSRGRGRGHVKTCFGCGAPGHINANCPVKKAPVDPGNKNVWCKFHKSSTHSDNNCRDQLKQNQNNKHGGGGGDSSKFVDVREHEHSFNFFQSTGKSSNFMVKSDYAPVDSTEICNIPEVLGSVDDAACRVDVGNSSLKTLLIDTGASSHIVTDISKFIKFNSTFQPEHHYIELADGRRSNNVALKKGTVVLKIKDKHNDVVDVKLHDVLYIPSYPQDIFSVTAATRNGGSIVFKKNGAELVCKDGTIFNVYQSQGLYYLDYLTSNSDYVASVRTLDLHEWHRIMGHCNVQDVLKLENLIQGMVIKSKSKFQCETCILGKMVQTFNRAPDERAKSPLELVHTDLCGPITPVAAEGFRYAFNIVDDFTGTIFVYFLKSKADTPKALETFLADTAPYGKVKLIIGDVVKTLRSDNGGEYVSKEFEAVMLKNNIKHEFSAPRSPHQNGTAERCWRTLFEMARCLLLEAKLPQSLWTYAVMCAAYIRNRCYNQRTQNIPFTMMTGKTPDMKKMHTFGTICYSYEDNAKKLEPRGKKGIFVGYDRSSPAYLVYDVHTKRISKHRCVTFTEKFEENLKKCPSPVVVDDVKRRVVPNPIFNSDDEDDFPNYVIPVGAVELATEETPDVSVGAVELATEETPDVPVTEHVEVIEEVEEIVIEEEEIDDEDNVRRYPDRERRLPPHLDEYVVNDRVCVVNHCYKVNSICIP